MKNTIKRFALRTMKLLLAAALLAGLAPETAATETLPLFSQTAEIRYIAHRGYHVQAPENTIPAFAAAAAAGYRFVESDVRFTKDGVAVLCHDSTINATARNADGSKIDGEKVIQNMTYEALTQYDFGLACGEAYRGTPITTFREWVAFCREAHLTPYIELKSEMTAGQIHALLAIVDAEEMAGTAVWISFSAGMLQTLVAANPAAEVGLLCMELTNAEVSAAKTLQTGENRVFLDALYTAVNSAAVQLALHAGLEVEGYTVDCAQSAAELISLGVAGITTDILLPPADAAEMEQPA